MRVVSAKEESEREEGDLDSSLDGKVEGRVEFASVGCKKEGEIGGESTRACERERERARE